jgi:hypothetical protein
MRIRFRILNTYYINAILKDEHKTDMYQCQVQYLPHSVRYPGTVFVRISDMARISASFGLFYVLWCYFEMRHYFNDVKVPKNAQDQCEYEYLFIF